mgnify:CR=1 FL=1
MRNNNGVLTIRLEKSAYDLKSSFDTDTTYAYMWNYEDRLNRFQLYQIDQILGSIRPGESIAKVDNTSIREAPLLTNTDITSDDKYFFINFLAHEIKDDSYWSVSLRNNLFQSYDGKPLPADFIVVTFGYVHLTK